MAKAADQFRSSDVTVWGIVALVAWGVAVLSANLSALVPASVYGALHASRLEGSTLNQLRANVATLEAEAARMQRDNGELLRRFALSEESTGEITRRVGALEISLPALIESQYAALEPEPVPQAVDPTPTGAIDPAPSAAIDPPAEVAPPAPEPIDTTATAAIGSKPITFEVDGGLVMVQQRPLIPGSDEVKLRLVPVETPMPAELTPSGGTIGLALGFPVRPEDAEARWQEMQSLAGTMLIGMSPVLGEAEGPGGKRLVAGPVLDRASALELCDRFSRQGVPCETVPFTGDPLPLLN
ncbi:MAG: hypothetical protein IPK28_06250 [Devosia sp.]|nr:hypothetical protein [Devosia sp.]